MIRVDVVTNSDHVLDAIVAFRRAVYRKARRDPTREDEWSRDELDEAAVHVTARDSDGEILGAARILLGDTWSLEHYYAFDYDKRTGAEFGRLAVSQKQCGSQRVLFELMRTACEYCHAEGRSCAYGFVIRRFRRQLERQGIPLDVLSPPTFPYGEEAFLVRFSFDLLLRYYRFSQQVRNGQKAGGS